jgi:hypothetical protein
MRRGGGLQLWIFVAVLIGEVLLYIELLRFFLALIGTWADVGSNFLGFWALMIIPGALVFGSAVVVIYTKLIRDSPELRARFLTAVYVGNFTLLFGSMAYYAARLHK